MTYDDLSPAAAAHATSGSPEDRRRLLLVADRLPGTDSGYGLRIANVVRGLAAVGDLDVIVLDSSRRGERYPSDLPGRVTVVRAEPSSRLAKALRILGRGPTSIHYGNHAEVLDAVLSATAGRSWHLTWFSRATSYHYGSAIQADGRIVDLDDLNDRLLRTRIRDRRAQHGRLRSLPRTIWDTIDASRWTRYQRSIAAEVDRVVVCSEIDLHRSGTTNGAVVPNGYPDPGEVHIEANGAVPRRLLFVGPLTYEPNLFAAEWLVRAILPRVRAQLPDIELQIVGDHEGVLLHRLLVEGVRIEGWVPDVASYYASAGVAVTPLHSGGGTRLKVIEAMARAVPLVSTSFGCEGLSVVAGRDLLVADDADSFADACVSALTDATLRHRLITAGLDRYHRDMSAARCSEAVARLGWDVLVGLEPSTVAGAPVTRRSPAR